MWQNYQEQGLGGEVCFAVWFQCIWRIKVEEAQQLGWLWLQETVAWLIHILRDQEAERARASLEPVLGHAHKGLPLNDSPPRPSPYVLKISEPL